MKTKQAEGKKIELTKVKRRWHVTTSDDGEYLFIELDGAPGEIDVKAEDEGFVIYIWSRDGKRIATTYTAYSAIEPDL